jgi:hypothetical protein
MSSWKVAICTLLVCLSLVLVNATNKHLRGPEIDTNNDNLNQSNDWNDRGDRILRLSTNQLVLGGGPIDPEECPAVASGANCPTDTGEDERTSCRGCKYANACQASGAGFLIRRDCQLAAFVNSGVEDFGNNLNCPNVKATDLCLDLIDPVACNNCEYGNGCFADQAGFNVKTECEKVATPEPVKEGFVNPALLNCRTPDPSFLCFDNILLTCGENECLYNSTCQANAATVALSTCRVIFDASKCQKVGFAGNFCAVGGDPVFCGEGCIYDNQCKANNAGYSTATCGPVPPPVVANTTDTEDTTGDNINTSDLPPANTPAVCDPSKCPPVLEAVQNSCGPVVNPIRCRDDCCEYSNRCLAAGAGFNTQLDCLLRNDEGSGSGTASNNDSAGGSNANSGGAGTDLPDLDVCPNVRDDIPCTGSSKPVLCRGCEYFNRCFAAGAGFNGDTCLLKGAPVVVAPPPPTLAPTPPTAPTPPPTFSPTTKPSPAPTQPRCPVSSTAKICSSAFNEVKCPDNCRYQNICKAQAAGFTTAQCPSSFASAPAPAPTFQITAGTAGSQPSAPKPAPTFSLVTSPSAPKPAPTFGGFGAGSNTSPTADGTSSFLNLIKGTGGSSPSGSSSSFGGLGGFSGTRETGDEASPASSSFNPFAPASTGNSGNSGGNNKTPTASPPKTNIFGFSFP